MSSLAEKMRIARQKTVPVGKYTFIVRRPTDLEMLAFQRDRRPESLLQYVVGWDAVTEADLLPGGDPHPVPFAPDVCVEWLADRMDLFGPVTSAVVSAYEDHVKAKDAATKN